MRTWADDLRRLCDALGLHKPVVLSSSFGGNVALTYAGLFPDHPGGVILANTTGGHQEQEPVIEAFGRLGGPEAAAIIRRTYDGDTRAQPEFNRVCYPLYSATPGWAEESREELVRQLPENTTRFVRLPGARHIIFRDRPDLAFPAVRSFVSQVSEGHPAS